MTAFTFISFQDVWALSSSLRSKVGLFNEDGIFPARQDGAWSRDMKEWNALRNVLGRMRAHSAAVQHDMGDVWLEKLAPHTESLWTEGGADAWVEVAIVTNPSAFVFCGTAWQHFPIGHAIAVNRGLRCCSVNWGDTDRYHLIVEFQKKESEDGESV